MAAQNFELLSLMRCLCIAVPEAPPTNVKTEAINSTAIQVWWKPPHPQKINGINQGYKLQAFIGNYWFFSCLLDEFYN